MLQFWGKCTFPPIFQSHWIKLSSPADICTCHHNHSAWTSISWVYVLIVDTHQNRRGLIFGSLRYTLSTSPTTRMPLRTCESYNYHFVYPSSAIGDQYVCITDPHFVLSEICRDVQPSAYLQQSRLTVLVCQLFSFLSNNSNRLN